MLLDLLLAMLVATGAVYLRLLRLSLAAPPCAMATVTWAFGPTGFVVAIVAHESAAESEINGDTPATGLNLSFRRLNVGQAIPTTRTVDAQGNVVLVSVSPLAVRAVITFADEGHIDANWIVTRDGITGKGTGKGTGKRTTG